MAFDGSGYLMSISTHAEYDPFAVAYDRLWGREFHAEVYPVLERLLLPGVARGSKILDVCCGTGQLTAIMARQFPVVGFDVSEQMVRRARNRLPTTPLLVADARRFALSQRFGAAYSVFDSLNHIPDGAGLKAVFRNVADHLRQGAPFLFDLINEQGFKISWNEANAFVENDIACITRSRYDPKARQGVCRVTVFSREETWQRHDFTLHQTCHKWSDVRTALQSSGFRDETLYDATDLGFSENVGFGRTFIVATRI